MPKVLANGLNFHYLQVGAGPDLVMLHGLTGNQAIWHLKIAPMLRSLFRITTFDLRGHGRSDMPPTGYTTGDMTEDLRAVMDALDIERADLVGHSLGGDIALNCALRYPERVRKLAVIEAGISALVDIRKDKDWAGWAYWAGMIEEFTGHKVPREHWNNLDHMVRLSLDAPIMYGLAKGLPRKQEPIRKLLDTTTMIRDYEVVGDLTLENLAKIPHPKLVCYDAGSPYMSTFNVLRDVLTNCTPLLFPESAHQHFSPLEQPEMLIEHLVAFFQPNETKMMGYEV